MMNTSTHQIYVISKGPPSKSFLFGNTYNSPVSNAISVLPLHVRNLSLSGRRPTSMVVFFPPPPPPTPPPISYPVHFTTEEAKDGARNVASEV